MDKRLRKKITTLFLGVVWVGVVVVAVIIAVARREEYGHFAYVVPGMAVFMLILFALAFLPKKISAKSFAEKLGELCTGGLLLIVLVVLGVAVYQKRGSVIGVAVLVLFFVAFLRIFIDWVKHYTNPRPKRRRGRKKTTATRERDTAGDAEGEKSANG